MNPYEGVLQAAANPAQSGAPVLPTGDNPTLRALHDIDFQLPLSNAGLKAMAGRDAAAEEARIFDTKQQIGDIADKADKSKYRRVKKDDGGFGFFDPTGKEISAYDYAIATDTVPSKVLEDSENPIDQQYLEDHNNLQEFLSAVYNKDDVAKEEYYNANPDLRSLSPAEVLKRFKQAYPTVYAQGGFTGPNTAGQPVGSTLIPSLRVLRGDTGEDLSAVGF